MKKWKPMFRKIFWGHGLQSSHQGRQRVTLIFRGVKLNIQKWGFHHIFCWSRSFCIYVQIWYRMRRNWDIAIWRFWLIVKLGFKCRNWSNSKSQNGFFPINSSWLIESKKTCVFKFEWVELILSAFEASPSVSGRGRWRVTRR